MSESKDLSIEERIQANWDRLKQLSEAPPLIINLDPSGLPEELQKIVWDTMALVAAEISDANKLLVSKEHVRSDQKNKPTTVSIPYNDFERLFIGALCLLDFIEMAHPDNQLIWIGDRETKVTDLPHFKEAKAAVRYFEAMDYKSKQV